MCSQEDEAAGHVPLEQQSSKIKTERQPEGRPTDWFPEIVSMYTFICAHTQLTPSSYGLLLLQATMKKVL